MATIGTIYCPEPTCRSKMVKRTNMTNYKQFYSCSRWPDCSETMPIPEREKLLDGGYVELPGFETEGN